MTRIIARTALCALLLPLATATLAQTPPTPSAADAQVDGNMTLAQFQAAQAQRMMVADTDGDGRISQAEWTAAVNARGGPGIHTTGGRSDAGPHGGYDPARAFARIDTNGDGFIDKAELDAASAQRFQRMDANGDGILTPEERAAHAGPHGRGGHGGREDGQPTPPSSPQP